LFCVFLLDGVVIGACPAARESSYAYQCDTVRHRIDVAD
jgi:hypothetical protein